MEPIKEEEDLVGRALNVIKKNTEWILYLQAADTSGGFLFLVSEILNDIKDAIYLDNPSHSAVSLSVTLNKCQTLLKQ